MWNSVAYKYTLKQVNSTLGLLHGRFCSLGHHTHPKYSEGFFCGKTQPVASYALTQERGILVQVGK